MEKTKAVLADWRNADVDARLKGALGFLEAMTTRPNALTASDAEAAFAAGVTKEALEEAALVAFCFNLIDRVADALEFEVPSPEEFDSAADFLLKHGYDN